MKRWNWCWDPRYWRIGRVEVGGFFGHRVYGFSWCFGPLEIQRWYGPLGIGGEVSRRGTP